MYIKEHLTKIVSKIHSLSVGFISCLCFATEVFFRPQREPWTTGLLNNIDITFLHSFLTKYEFYFSIPALWFYFLDSYIFPKLGFIRPIKRVLWASISAIFFSFYFEFWHITLRHPGRSFVAFIPIVLGVTFMSSFSLTIILINKFNNSNIAREGNDTKPINFRYKLNRLFKKSIYP